MNNYNLTDKEIVFVYRDIVLQHVNVSMNGKLKNYNIHNKQFKDYIKKENIIFKTATAKLIPQVPDKSNLQFFYFTKNGNIAYSLFTHLRNCFAHGNFKEIEINGSSYLEMFDKYRLNFTMKAQIKKSNFQEFIDNLLTLTQPYNNKKSI